MPKIVISDPKTGKSYQTELDPSKMSPLVGKKIGDEIDGSVVGLAGYKLRITGGTDKQGFPMRKGIHKAGRTSILLSGGPGIAKSKDGVRRRKTVVGEIVSEELEQINTVVSSYGKTPLDTLLKKEEQEGSA